MRLMPKRVKFRKTQRRRIKGNATKGHSMDPGWITAQQLEAGRVAVSHFLGREGKLVIRVFPQKSVSSKPIETRMGKGKGEPEFWVAVVKPGTVIYEIGGVPEAMARQAFNRVAHKLPVSVRMITRRV